jgi:hypothetical protein
MGVLSYGWLLEKVAESTLSIRFARARQRLGEKFATIAAHLYSAAVFSLMVCPKCRSRTIHRSHRKNMAEIALGVALLPWRCSLCYARFFRPRGMKFPSHQETASLANFNAD